MIKNRFATWALNEKEEKILVTLELNTDNFNVDIQTLKGADVNTEFADSVLKNWVDGGDVVFPDSTEKMSRSFTDESILPENIKIEGKTGAIRQLQNEWSYLLLSTKLFSQFIIEMEELKRKASELKSYSSELFEEAKAFWEKVLEYRKEREISQDKLNGIKEEINQVFDHLKVLKENMIKEKDAVSEKVKTEIFEAIAVVKKKMEGKDVHFKSLMDELKEIQNGLRTTDVKRDVKNLLFDEIQNCFEFIKTKRDEVLGGGVKNRVDGLSQVAEKMRKSLEMDLKDLEFNRKKLSTSNTRLEEQLREAKINVLKDKIESKEAKLADIQATLDKLQQKMTTSKEKSTDSDKKEVKVTIKNDTAPEHTETPNQETPSIENEEATVVPE
jgi:chromosome segregation ATPase